MHFSPSVWTAPTPRTPSKGRTDDFLGPASSLLLLLHLGPVIAIMPDRAVTGSLMGPHHRPIRPADWLRTVHHGCTLRRGCDHKEMSLNDLSVWSKYRIVGKSIIPKESDGPISSIAILSNLCLVLSFQCCLLLIQDVSMKDLTFSAAGAAHFPLK